MHLEVNEYGCIYELEHYSKFSFLIVTLFLDVSTYLPQLPDSAEKQLNKVKDSNTIIALSRCPMQTDFFYDPQLSGYLNHSETHIYTIL